MDRLKAERTDRRGEEEEEDDEAISFSSSLKRPASGMEGGREGDGDPSIYVSLIRKKIYLSVEGRTDRWTDSQSTLDDLPDGRTSSV